MPSAYGISGPLLNGDRQETAHIQAAAFCGGSGAGARGIGYQEECSPTLKAGGAPSILCLNDQGGSRLHMTGNRAGTLRAQEHGHQTLILDDHVQDPRLTGQVPVQNILTDTNQSGVVTQPCSAASNGDKALAGQGTCKGEGHGESICQPYQETIGTISYSDHKGVNNQYVNQDKCIVGKRNLIRRLTPLECERLQGSPDGWTDIPGASDSARYKALGNSVAIPCVDFVMRGIAYFLGKPPAP